MNVLICLLIVVCNFYTFAPIKYADDEVIAHEWWFRVKPKWYQFQRILDPELSVRENKVKENTIIICERIENRGL